MYKKTPNLLAFFHKIVPKYTLSANTLCFKDHVYFIVSLDMDCDYGQSQEYKKKKLLVLTYAKPEPREDNTLYTLYMEII